MKLLEIPVGVDRFEDIINEENYYVDKTHLIQKLVKSSRTNKKRSGRYFLSRPRRFGKSLLVDTIQCLFEGRKDLFEGLAIYEHWDFSDQHPVIKLSLDIGGMATTEAIHGSVIQQLEIVEKEYELPPGSEKAKDNASNRLADVLHIRDEETGKTKRASDHLDCLREIYGCLKGCSNHIHFIFITGISLLAKTNLFTGLNNLINISVESEFATICGYTEDEIRSVFAPEIERFELTEIRRWYDGYSCYQIAVLDTEIPQADHTRSSTQLQLSHYNEWE